MKKLALYLLIGFASLHLAAADEPWHTALPEALAVAKKEKKNLLLDFTGSDWCPSCKILKREIYSTKEFLEYAKTQLILVEVDLPENKPQPPELKEANQNLVEKFKIQSYPTTLILNADGKELSRYVGYAGETVKDYIVMLKKAAKKKPH